VIPERLADKILGKSTENYSDSKYHEYIHFSDTHMNEREIHELPKVWAVGGDGGFGDIGFQNVSKVILQNRPNVKVLMLDTHVYSNTGGQNSDSTPTLGGGDMNSFGYASQGKLTERKSVAEIFTSGHGSPYVAMVSMANSAKLYGSILECLDYRGTAFMQCYTPCQPEHGISDSASTQQAQSARDSRAMPEFVFNSSLGETFSECYDLKGNPTSNRDWYETKFSSNSEKYKYTVAHWCATEARFRRHIKRINPEQAEEFISLDEILLRITQNDVIERNHLNESHRAFIPDFKVYIKHEDAKGRIVYSSISRQMVLFCVERRKAWRLLQSKAGITNHDYLAQMKIIRKLDSEKIEFDDFMKNTSDLVEKEYQNLKSAK
jgi:pyruvate-ferredoxin/flavodoxin oxidoreductase